MAVYTTTATLLGFSTSEIAKVTTTLANADVANPWTRAIAEAVDMIDTYAASYTLTDSTYNRLIKPLVIHDLYSLMRALTDQQVKDFESAMSELKDIRDGKVPLPLNDPLPTLNASGSMGSDDVVEMAIE
jgi:phage gp36-like protein